MRKRYRVKRRELSMKWRFRTEWGGIERSVNYANFSKREINEIRQYYLHYILYIFYIVYRIYTHVYSSEEDAGGLAGYRMYNYKDYVLV